MAKRKKQKFKQKRKANSTIAKKREEFQNAAEGNITEIKLAISSKRGRRALAQLSPVLCKIG